jgi:hypothetical protein
VSHIGLTPASGGSLENSDQKRVKSVEDVCSAVDSGNFTLTVNGEPVEAVIKYDESKRRFKLESGRLHSSNHRYPQPCVCIRRMHSNDRVVVVRAVSSFSVISKHNLVVCRAIGR